MTEQNGRLVATGWLLLLDGPFDGFELRAPPGVDGIVERVARPDLSEALPHIPDASCGGFRLSARLPNLAQGQTLDITLLGQRRGEVCGRMNIGYSRAPDQPLPPAHLRKRVAQNEDVGFWRSTAIKTCNDFLRYAASQLRLTDVRDVLDWGCGAGRLTFHLKHRLPNAHVRGADIDGEAIDWCNAHLGAGDFTQCGLEPPLSYGPSSMDLVVALSVFTHLTRGHQTQWLREIQRILKPGGLLVATTHGEFAGRWCFPDAGKFQEVFADGFFDGFADESLGEVASGSYYRATFQSREYTEREWNRVLPIVGHVVGGLNNFQDVFLLRKDVS